MVGEITNHETMLGRVDGFEQDEAGGQGDEGSEAFSQFVVARRNPPELFNAAEEALDQVAIFVLVLIKRPLDDPMTARRDDGINTAIREMIEDGVRVVGFIRAERVRLKIAQQR